MVLKMWSTDVPKTLLESLQGHIYFCINDKTSFAFFTMLTFTLTVQSQCWVKLMALALVKAVASKCTDSQSIHPKERGRGEAVAK